VRLPDGIRNVWVDVGTAGRSDLEANLLLDPSLYLIGIEPTPHYARRMKSKLARSSASERFTIVERACTQESGQSLTFYVHPQQECNSLNPTNPDSPPIFGGDCVGTPPRAITVQSLTLQELLLQLPPEMRVQLLKVDVQGHEWPCVAGAFDQLDRVDNIHLEVQDLPSNTTSMYEGQLSLGGMDEHLRGSGFFRQYCEVNNHQIREMNCLYTRRGRAPLWVTGRPQQSLPAVKFDMDAPPSFEGVTYVAKFLTSKVPGAQVGRLRRLGMLN